MAGAQSQRRAFGWEARRILVPVKGERVDEDALRLAGEVARRNKGVVYAVHVIEVDRSFPLEAQMDSAIEKGDKVLGRVEELARQAKYSVETEVLQAREVGPAVVEEARERDADLLILGLSYKETFGEFSLGHVAPYILKHAPCPVWLCREGVAVPSQRV
jgi:nucleotide-binding universal stress UspA family protein